MGRKESLFLIYLLGLLIQKGRVIGVRKVVRRLSEKGLESSS